MAPRSLFRHILVPHDFSEQATVALETAGRLASEHRGRLTVPHVLGRVAERVVRHATVPVLTLRVPARKRRKARA